MSTCRFVAVKNSLRNRYMRSCSGKSTGKLVELTMGALEVGHRSRKSLPPHTPEQKARRSPHLYAGYHKHRDGGAGLCKHCRTRNWLNGDSRDANWMVWSKFGVTDWAPSSDRLGRYSIRLVEQRRRVLGLTRLETENCDTI